MPGIPPQGGLSTDAFPAVLRFTNRLPVDHHPRTWTVPSLAGWVPVSIVAWMARLLRANPIPTNLNELIAEAKTVSR